MRERVAEAPEEWSHDHAGSRRFAARRGRGRGHSSRRRRPLRRRCARPGPLRAARALPGAACPGRLPVRSGPLPEPRLSRGPGGPRAASARERSDAGGPPGSRESRRPGSGRRRGALSAGDLLLSHEAAPRGRPRVREGGRAAVQGTPAPTTTWPSPSKPSARPSRRSSPTARGSWRTKAPSSTPSSTTTTGASSSSRIAWRRAARTSTARWSFSPTAEGPTTSGPSSTCALKDHAAARKDAERALSLRDPSGLVLDLQVYYLLSTVYARLGEVELARKYAELSRTTPIPDQARDEH